MDRRTFLKATGVSSAALTLPALGPATPALASTGQTNAHFVALSTGGVDAAGVHHVMAMSGDGFVNPGQAVANGTFVHFNNDPALPTPKPVLGTGTWKSRRLRSFEEPDPSEWGVFVAGTLVVDIDLVPEGGSRIPAVLTVNCNLGPAGIFTGLPEGFLLEVAGLSFEPFVPPLGLTVFTRAVEARRGG